MFGAVSRTSIETPSITLVDKVLQRKPIPNVPAIQWGNTNEDVARKEYYELVKAMHTSFELNRTGLHICEEYPYL